LALLWGDSHYGGTLIEWVKKHFGFDIEIVRRLGIASDAETLLSESKPASKKPSFQILPRRWVVERSFAGDLRGGVVLPAITRDCQKAVRHSSKFRQAGACSRTSRLLFRERPSSYTLLGIASTGQWHLQHINVDGTFVDILNSHISLSNRNLPVTIEIIGKNGVLDISLYQEKAPQSPTYVFPEPNGSYSPMGVVGLMVQRHQASQSSAIQFTNVSLDVPG